MPSFTPSTPIANQEFTPDPDDEVRGITYGDEPPLDGSILYGQEIGADGFLEAAEEPEVGTFTPS